MLLAPQHIDIWYADLRLVRPKHADLIMLLSEREKERAARFRFPIHEQRFVAAHGLLRQLLTQYVDIAPANIQYDYNDQQKPFLTQQPDLFFNLSHSHHMAVFAFTRHYPIGVDIEKIQSKFKPGLAKRFFSAAEYASLVSLPAEQQAAAFYKIWAYKEALIKGVGKGLALPLASFSVELDKSDQNLMLEARSWSLHELKIHEGYQSAVATAQQIRTEHIRCREVVY